MGAKMNLSQLLEEDVPFFKTQAEIVTALQQKKKELVFNVLSEYLGREFTDADMLPGQATGNEIYYEGVCLGHFDTSFDTDNDFRKNTYTVTLTFIPNPNVWINRSDAITRPDTNINVKL